MKDSKTKILTLALLIVSPVHQSLVTFSAQENDTAYEALNHLNQTNEEEIIS